MFNPLEWWRNFQARRLDRKKENLRALIAEGDYNREMGVMSVLCAERGHNVLFALEEIGTAEEMDREYGPNPFRS